MKIIICGAGKVGLAIASQLLLNKENEIVVIDFDQEKLNKAQTLDVKTVFGLPSSPDTLNNAGAITADLIICVMQTDEINILTAHIAGTMFSVKNKIARVKNKIYINEKWYSQIYNNKVLDVDHILAPEITVAKRIVEMLFNIGMEDRFLFYNGNYSFFSIFIRKSFAGKTIKDIYEKVASNDIDIFSIKFVKRNNKIHFCDEGFLLNTNDEIYILCSKRDEKEILNRIYGNTSNIKNILICGGGEVGLNVAKIMEDDFFSVKILENNAERCQFLSQELQDTVVIQGNMHNKSDLQDFGKIDVMINVSGEDDANVFATLLGKSMQFKECFTLIDDYSNHDIFKFLKLRNIISTKNIVISEILRCIGGQKFSMQEIICGGFYSVCEFAVKKNAEINGLECNDLEDFEGIILAIIRNSELLNGHKNQRFTENDTVLMLVPFYAVSKLEKVVG